MTQVVLEDIKAIAFDLDGTLVDSAGGLAEAIDNMLLLNRRLAQPEQTRLGVIFAE